VYTSKDLGLFNKGQQLPTTIVNNINTSIDSVLFPAMSSHQESKERVKSMTRRSIKVSSYIMWPLMLGLCFTATTVISLLLTDKWLGAVVYLRVFCITYAFYPIHTANLNAIKAMGRSDIYLILEVFKKSFGIITMIATMWISVEAMAYSLLLVSVVSQMINAWPNRKLLNYSYLEQLKDILPAILVSLVACLCIMPFNFIVMPKILKLGVQVIIAAVVYVGISKIFKMESYTYIIDTIKGMKKKES
jgi:O-antigen/teichoic acid export membrane protein